MARHNVSLARLAVIASVVAAGLGAACQTTHAGCVKGTISADAGRIVSAPNAFVELRARFTAKGTSIAGATLAYIFTFDDPTHGRHELTLKEAETDSSGVAVARLTLEELPVDERLNGTFAPRYEVAWEHTQRVGTAQYCATSDQATLPVDQFPPATSPR